MSTQIVIKLLAYFSEIISSDIEDIKVTIDDGVSYIIDIKSGGNTFQIDHLECHNGTHVGDGPYYMIHILKDGMYLRIKTEYNAGHEYKNGTIGTEFITFEEKKLRK